MMGKSRTNGVPFKTRAPFSLILDFQLVRGSPRYTPTAGWLRSATARVLHTLIARGPEGHAPHKYGRTFFYEKRLPR